MGYYAYIRDYDVRITDLKRAVKLMKDSDLLLGTGTDLEDFFRTWGYDDFEFDADGNITMLSYNDKYGDDDAFWRTLAPVITSIGGKYPAFIEWQGEDHETWRFVFKDGEMHETGCDVTWPYLGETVKATAVVEPLTLGEESTGLLATTIEAHIDYLESLQEAGKEWYEDRYRQPGSTRPPYPDNIDALIREAKMTLKSIKDAERVVLNLEVIQ